MLPNPDKDMDVLKEFMATAGSLPALIIDIRGKETHTKPDILVEMTAADLVTYMNAISKRLTGPDLSWDVVLRKCLTEDK